MKTQYDYIKFYMFREYYRLVLNKRCAHFWLTVRSIRQNWNIVYYSKFLISLRANTFDNHNIH